tara:strand:- start:89 stop:487 length:399 start_codon:yes stop_codon:yes gene_type:complete
METNSNLNNIQDTTVVNLNNTTYTNNENNNDIDFTNAYDNIRNNINSIGKVIDFDNTNEFEYYTKHMDDLIDLHYELKEDNSYLGIMNTSRPFKFVTIIMRNLYFQNKDDNETRDNEYSDNENIEQDIILTR